MECGWIHGHLHQHPPPQSRRRWLIIIVHMASCCCGIDSLPFPFALHGEVTDFSTSIAVAAAAAEVVPFCSAIVVKLYLAISSLGLVFLLSLSFFETQVGGIFHTYALDYDCNARIPSSFLFLPFSLLSPSSLFILINWSLSTSNCNPLEKLQDPPQDN